MLPPTWCNRLAWAPGMKLNNITDISVSNILTEAKHQCMRKVMESTGLELVAFLN